MIGFGPRYSLKELENENTFFVCGRNMLISFGNHIIEQKICFVMSLEKMELRKGKEWIQEGGMKKVTYRNFKNLKI